MSVSSKTGLIPIQSRLSRSTRRKHKLASNTLITSTVAKSAEFSIRPFGGLFNPYSKGCSVLCNHPAPTAVRTIIRKLKESWSSEGKIYWQECLSQKEKFEAIQDDITGNIPDDLFRRYTDTDSRPLTPSPTTASVHTRTSAGSFLNARRCVTPEPGKDAINKRKKIILDLRRSHSQETLCWKASSEVSQGIGAGLYTPASTCYLQNKVSKIQKAEDHKFKKSQISHDELPPMEDIKQPVVCINEREIDENDGLQRRGKKKKKGKQQISTSTFHISQDPETQVSALGPDSLSASTRPSLVPNVSVKLLTSENNLDNKPTQLQNSYLTEEVFRALKTELNIDIIENTFERYLNRALREAIKYVSPKKERSYVTQNLVDKVTDLPFEHNKMPRKFSKSASRFEVPINLATLEENSRCCLLFLRNAKKLTVVKLKGTGVYEYLSKHVWVSRQRKQLYKKIFLKYLVQEELLESAENPEFSLIKERAIPVSNFNKALTEVLGFYGTAAIIQEIGNIVKIHEQQEVNFRAWCGIVAFAERFALSDPSFTDSCDELEKADFDTIEQKIDTLQLSADLSTVLHKIREGHGTSN